jgi:CheY-like chemotaxis protein
MGPVVEKLLAGSEAYRTDQARLTKLIGALKAPTEYARRSAAAELRRAHAAGAVALVAALANDKFAKLHPEIADTLVTLGEDAVGPVMAGLNSDDPALVARLIGVATRLQNPRLSFFLARPIVDPQAPPELASAAHAALEAMRQRPIDAAEGRLMLSREIARLLAAALRESASSEADTDLWRWDPAERTTVAVRGPRAADYADRAARLAVDLMAMTPDDPDTQRYGLTVRLTAAKLDQDLDAPLPTGEGTAHDAAVAAGADLVNEVLSKALADGNSLAATAAAQILSEIGQSKLLASAGGGRTPLSAALASPDRRVRFAALEAVFKLAPDERFVGDNDVVKNLGFLANTTGTRRVLIGHPRLDMGRLLAGLLAASGYETELVTNGREVFKAATTSPDFEFALLHISLQNTQLDDLLASLRGDYRSAGLPIGLLSLSMDQKMATRVAAGFPPATTFTEPGSAAVMKIRADEVLNLVGRYSPPFAERQREAKAAVSWIAELAARRESVFDLQPLIPALILAADVPELRPAASAALVSLGTVAGQRAILDIVNNSTQQTPVRTAAAKSFRESVALHGILLTKTELEKQYGYYNASATADPKVQELLGAVLDTLEDPKAIAVGPPKSSHRLSP